MAGLAVLVGALVGLTALLACLAGAVWGPLILVFVFAGFGLAMLGTSSWGPVLGVAFLGGAVVELMATNQFWVARARHLTPSAAWRAASSLVGLVGLAAVALVVYAILAFIAWISSL